MLRHLISLLAAPAIAGAQQMTDTTFHPITSAEAVRLAKENNVSAITSANAIRAATNNIRSARAQLYPTLTASAGQNRSAGERVGPSGTIINYNPGWTYNTGLQSQFTLFDAGKTFADVRARKADVAAAEAASTTNQFSVAFQVKQAYNSILAAKESETAARAQLAAAEAQLATSIARVNAGAANVSDSLRSVVLVGNAQLALLTAQNNYRVQSATLTRLVGTAYFVTADLADTVDHPVAPIDSAAVMQMALAGPAIRQVEAQLNSASAAERSAKAAYLPTIGGNLSYGGNGTGPYGFGNNPFPYSRTIGISLNYQLFNRFTRENQVATAQINYDNAQAQLRDQRLAAQQNIITAISSMRTAEETMRVQQTNVRASEEDLRVQQQRYNLGASTLLDVLNSQTALGNARQQLIQARLNYRNARAQIEAVIGRDLP